VDAAFEAEPPDLASTESYVAGSNSHAPQVEYQGIRGRYVTKKLLGKGGMGEVWLAEHANTAQRVALKVPQDKLSELDQARFARREARAQNNLQHPRIVRILDCHLPHIHEGMSEDEQRRAVRQHGPSWIAMEYVGSGKTLADVIAGVAAGQGPTFDSRARLLLEIAEAIQFAHSQDPSVYHRDLKPANVLIDGDGHAKVADFGLAVHEDEQRTAVLGGTPLYSSPEQVRNERDAYAAPDIW
jgi:serine/threonine protein kinase